MHVDLDKSVKTKDHTIAARQNSIPNYTIFDKNIKVIKDSVLLEIKTHENKFFGSFYVIIYLLGFQFVGVVSSSFGSSSAFFSQCRKSLTSLNATPFPSGHSLLDSQESNVSSVIISPS